MPIYGYKCDQCGHQLEVLQSLSAEPLRICPECGGPLRKLLYPAGIVFKGSGFYSTDYKRSSSGSPASKGSGGSGGDSGAGGSDSGGDGKAGSSSEPSASSGAAAPGGQAAAS